MGLTVPMDRLKHRRKNISHKWSESMYLLKSRYFRCTGTHREICLSSKQFAFCIWRHESKCAHNTCLYSVTQSKSKTQEHCNVHCKFNCITVNVDWTQHGIYNKTVLTLSTSVISFINGGIFSEQKRITSLLPKWDLLSQDRYKTP